MAAAATAFSLLLAAACASGLQGGGKLLLVLVDGCRWDYPESAGLSGFRRLAEEGVRAPHVTPVFPSNSYPNWYTIVTGLYAESHGFVQNTMFDPLYGDFFLMTTNDTNSVHHWWQLAEPLWVTAEKKGLRSALYWWDGCQVEIRGKKPTYCREYRYVGSSWPRVNEDTAEALATALHLLAKDEIRLAQVYFESVDYYGHTFGPDSDECKRAVRDADHLLDEVQRLMDEKGLLDEVNLVVVSDHGMASSQASDFSVIDLQQILDVSDIRYMVYAGTSTMILPHEGKLDKVYDALRGVAGLRVYKKEEIPERYHIKNSRLTLPLLLVASENYFIRGLDIPGKSIPPGSSISPGCHGYDPQQVPDMRGIFFARGPKLKRNYTSPPLQMVDIYNVLCDLLDIEPLPNNGTRALTNGMMAGGPVSSAGPLRSQIAIAAVLLLCLIYWRRHLDGAT